MTVVKVTGDQGTAPILIEVGDFENTQAQDFYADLPTRMNPTKLVTSMARHLYSDAIELACNVATQTSERLGALNGKDQPDEFEVSFALNLDAAVGAKIVEVGSEAQVQVRMQWNRRTGE
ncbi:MAG TPA: CU044_2847 family protein [Trebonia sp.]|jgi:hypothetical protein|nr:CU044_2847 family protein [Trebonia sp.]